MLRTSTQIGTAGWIRVVALFAGLLWTIYSGFRPGLGDSARWYDRTIRTVGGLVVLVGMAYGFFLLLTDR